ncbi:unnamed protein product, partial [Oppiella nova]
MDSSVEIQEFGNVYHVNESHWFAITGSWVQYKCRHDNSLPVGSAISTCLSNNTWSSKSPFCIPAHSFMSEHILYIIIGGLFTILIALRLNKKLCKTREEIEMTVQRQISHEVYADDTDDMPCNNYGDYSEVNLEVDDPDYKNLKSSIPRNFA